MPVVKNGDRYTYFPPTPQPCQLCGASVVIEYGTLDARAYQEGWVLHHHCDVKVEPLNEREWRELQARAQAAQPEPQPLPVPVMPRRRLPAQRLDETWLL